MFGNTYNNIIKNSKFIITKKNTTISKDKGNKKFVILYKRREQIKRIQSIKVFQYTKLMKSLKNL